MLNAKGRNLTVYNTVRITLVRKKVTLHSIDTHFDASATDSF